MRKILDILSFLSDNEKAKTKTKRIQFYTTKSGRSPAYDWLEGLDYKTQKRVISRINRLKHGQYGDFKKIDSRLFELRFFFGKGYRLYFIEKSKKIVLLLIGGNKDTKARDIKKAQLLLKEYLKLEDA